MVEYEVSDEEYVAASTTAWRDFTLVLASIGLLDFNQWVWLPLLHLPLSSS